MNALGQYKKEHDLTSEQLAAELSDKLNRNISAKGVEMQLKRREPSLPWLNALGISPREPGNLKNSPPNVNPTEISPGTAIALPFEVQSAKETIKTLYVIAGKGAAMASRTPGVANAWEAAAPGLAEAWIKWAEENKTVASGIAMLTVGGPGGQVILMNATLLVTTLMAIQSEKGLPFIPPGYMPPHENPDMDDDKIRENTEAFVDHGLRNSQPSG